MDRFFKVIIYIPEMSTPVERGKLLRISSEDGEEKSTNANFTVILNNAPFIQDVRGMVIKSVSFKHVFPNIFDGNNVFTFIYNGGQQSVAIQPAWYDVDTFPLALQTAINTVTANPVTVVATITPAGAASVNKKLVFTASGGDTIGLVSADDGNAMATVCGISTTTAEAVSVTAQWLIDLGGLGQVYLHCQQICAQHSTASSNNAEPIPIVVEIPINVPFGSQVFYNSRDSTLDSIIYPSSRAFTRMEFSLRTRAGNILDLQQHQLVTIFKLIPSEYFGHD